MGIVMVIRQGDREANSAPNDQAAKKDRGNAETCRRDLAILRSAAATRRRSENGHSLVRSDSHGASVLINDAGGTRACANTVARDNSAAIRGAKAVATVDGDRALNICKHRGFRACRQQRGANGYRHESACCPSSILNFHRYTLMPKP
jgi:hypothetical protein